MICLACDHWSLTTATLSPLGLHTGLAYRACKSVLWAAAVRHKSHQRIYKSLHCALEKCDHAHSLTLNPCSGTGETAERSAAHGLEVCAYSHNDDTSVRAAISVIMPSLITSHACIYVLPLFILPCQIGFPNMYLCHAVPQA